MAKTIEDVGERLKTIIKETDRAGSFIWKTLSEVLIYSANRIPEISDDIISIDNAMKWGFNWELGPFETWDALGLETVALRIEREGRPVPELVQKALTTSEKRFYVRRKGTLAYFDLKASEYREAPPQPGILFLSVLKEQGKLIRKNSGASLIDLGDGVACVEFHSKMNSIGGDTLQVIQEGLKLTQENFEGLVIGNQGQNFSVGAN